MQSQKRGKEVAAFWAQLHWYSLHTVDTVKHLFKFWSNCYRTYPMQQRPRTDASTSQFCADLNLIKPLSLSAKNWIFSVLQYVMSLAPFPPLSSVQEIWPFSWSLNHTTLTRLLLLSRSRGIFVSACMYVSDLLSWSCEWRKLSV